MKNYKYIIEAIDGHIGRLILNRPEIHNALHIEMIREMTQSIQDLNKQEAVRLIKIEAKGKNFSAGADLSWMKEGLNQSEDQLLAESEELAYLFNTIYNSSKVTLVSAQGKIMGGANGILAAADIVMASNETLIFFSEARLGLIPATIAPYLVQKVEKNVAKEWMLSGRTIEIKEAYQRGLINQVFSKESTDYEVDKYIHSLLKSGPKALEGIKMMFRNKELFQHPDDQIKESAKLIAQFRVSTEGQEGIGAFLEKRQPNWRNE